MKCLLFVKCVQLVGLLSLNPVDLLLLFFKFVLVSRLELDQVHLDFVALALSMNDSIAELLSYYIGQPIALILKSVRELEIEPHGC